MHRSQELDEVSSEGLVAEADQISDQEDMKKECVDEFLKRVETEQEGLEPTILGALLPNDAIAEIPASSGEDEASPFAADLTQSYIMAKVL